MGAILKFGGAVLPKGRIHSFLEDIVDEDNDCDSWEEDEDEEDVKCYLCEGVILC